ncbi:MAG: DUF2608 domain-containing protein [Chlamydiota bacterium]
MRQAITMLTALLVPLISQAAVIQTARVALIDEDTWFLVDLDNTLFEAKQAFGHIHWFYDEVDLRMQRGMTRDEAFLDAYPNWIKAQQICPVKPLEEEFVTSLFDLQQKGIVVMGLTNRHPCAVPFTKRQVGSLGIDLTATAPAKHAFCVPAENPTLFSDGVLFCSDYNLKGDVFLSLLTLIGQCPKKVVFIDDRIRNVEEVEEKLSQYGIECTGVHYTAYEHVAPVYSRELANYQAKFLEQILSNEAAALLLHHGLE